MTAHAATYTGIFPTALLGTTKDRAVSTLQTSMKSDVRYHMMVAKVLHSEHSNYLNLMAVERKMERMTRPVSALNTLRKPSAARTRRQTSRSSGVQGCLRWESKEIRVNLAKTLPD